MRLLVPYPLPVRLLLLNRKVAEEIFLKRMDHHEVNRQLRNYIRIHRKNAGITQAELGRALGYRSADTVARHERFEFAPSLEIAISYEIIFRAPVGEIFAGLRQKVEDRVETSLAEFELRLGKQSLRDGNAHATARKLIWLRGRNNTQSTA